MGSTSVKRIERGYHGSVASKEYRDEWATALKNEPEKFKTCIIRKCDTRKDAFALECKLQESLDVVRSHMYVNKSLARKNGFFGGEQHGKANHMYGKVTNAEVKQKISAALTGKSKSTETKARMKAARNARPPAGPRTMLALKLAGEKRRGANHVFFGKSRPTEVRKAISASKAGKCWWTDGETSRFTADPPAPHWVKGMAKRAQKQSWC